jgi:hypothetical protein
MQNKANLKSKTKLIKQYNKRRYKRKSPKTNWVRFYKQTQFKEAASGSDTITPEQIIREKFVLISDKK